MTLPPIFSPEYYAYWRDFEARHWWTAGMRDVASMLFGLVGLPTKGVLLDVGCGSGQGMHWFAGVRPEWKTVGVDLGMDGLVAALHSGLPTVALGTATCLPIASGSVDAVITLDVLQHLPLDGGDRAALREMHRVLKPGGYVFIRTNVQSFPRAPDDPEAVWRKYDPEDLNAKLKAAGFSVVRLSRINALLGLAEIPGDLKRRREKQRHTSYDLVAKPMQKKLGLLTPLKRAWLRLEGRAVRSGVKLPVGRSLVSLARRD
jgi:SAM-dependent methyltransferase